MKKVLLVTSLLAIALGSCKEKGEAANTRTVFAQYVGNNTNSHTEIVTGVPTNIPSGSFIAVESYGTSNDTAKFSTVIADTSEHVHEPYQIDFDIPEGE